jgi:hypothetical protein
MLEEKKSLRRLANIFPANEAFSVPYSLTGTVVGRSSRGQARRDDKCNKNNFKDAPPSLLVGRSHAYIRPDNGCSIRHK